MTTLFLSCSMLLGAACSTVENDSPGSRASSPPVVLLVTTEALPSVALDLFATPNLDLLAERGGRGLQIAGSSALTPALVTLHSGSWWQQDVLPESAVTLAEHLSAQGYRSYAFTSGRGARATAGLGQGFESFSGGGKWQSLIDLLSSSSGGTFVWAHLVRPRPPWTSADGETLNLRTVSRLDRDDPRQLQVWKLYGEAVSRLDNQVGAMVQAAQASAREQQHELLVVFTSAQGIELAGFERIDPSAVEEPFGLAQGLSRHLLEVPVIAAWWSPADGWELAARSIPVDLETPRSSAGLLPALLGSLGVAHGPALRRPDRGSWSRLRSRTGEERSWLSPSGVQVRWRSDGTVEWRQWQADGAVALIEPPGADLEPPPMPWLAGPTRPLPEDLSLRAVRRAVSASGPSVVSGAPSP